MGTHDTRWIPAPDDTMLIDASLRRGTVHVWRSSVTAAEKNGEALYRTLSPDERARADRFFRDADRRRFIAGRGMLRDVLARSIATRPETVEFAYGPYGKPALRSPPGRVLSFNLSHSGDWTACAVVAGGAIGIDLESMESSADIAGLAKHVFSPAENVAFLRRPAQTRRARFFEAWSSKEAYIKAIGKGLSCPMPDVEIVYDGDFPVGIASSPAWVVRRIDVAHGYAGAIAVGGPITGVDFYDWCPAPG